MIHIIKNITIWLSGTVFSLSVLAQDIQKGNDLEKTLNVIETKVEEKKINIFEYPELLFNIPEYATLEAQAKSQWRYALTNLATVAPSAFRQRVLFEAFQGLDTNSYLEFLNRATSLCENGQISKPIFSDILSPSGRMQGFLLDNYKHPAIRSLLERVKRLFSDDPRELKALDSILSGEAKTMMDVYRGAHANVKGESPIEMKLDPAVPTATKPIPSKESGLGRPEPTTEVIPVGSDTTKSAASPINHLWYWVVGVAVTCMLVIILTFRASKGK